MKKTVTIVLSTLTIVALSGTAFAWVDPVDGQNITAPLNTSSVGQTKLGGLVLNLGNAVYGLIVKNGNSGFGLEQPTERVDVNGNIKLNGRVIGMEAPIEGKDGANKNYVDAMGGGGGTYTAWGKTECASGWTKAYEGVGIVPTVFYPPGQNGGGPVCGLPLKKQNGRANLQWFDGGSNVEYGSYPCAVCVK